MATPSNPPPSLDESLKTATSLLSHVVSEDSDGSSFTSAAESCDSALSALGDAARLLKAHVTKLGLLATTKPFPSTAVRKVLQELNRTCLPAFLAATHTCVQHREWWGSFMSKEVERRSNRVQADMSIFLREIAMNSQRVTNVGGRDTLGSIGIVWQRCDEVIELQQGGMAGLAVSRAEVFRSTIQDAIEELTEWRNGTALDTEGTEDELLHSDNEAVQDEDKDFDQLFHAANSMPNDRPALTEMVQSTEALLKKIVLLYRAIEKRRLQTLPDPSSPQCLTLVEVTRLDSVLKALEDIPHSIDDLISTFYDLDEVSAADQRSRVLENAKEVASTMQLGWNGIEDEFTVWIEKWLQAVS